jgi:hypothetical protein
LTLGAGAAASSPESILASIILCREGPHSFTSQEGELLEALRRYCLLTGTHTQAIESCWNQVKRKHARNFRRYACYLVS